MKLLSLPALLLAVALLFLSLSPPSLVRGSLIVQEEPADLDPWSESLAALMQRISSLPTKPFARSAAQATKFVEALRARQVADAEAEKAAAAGDGAAPPSEQSFARMDWAYRCPSVRITRAERLAFPESISGMEPRFDGSVLDLDEDSDDEEGPDLGGDLDVKRVRPRIHRASLLHVLAMRGFDQALKRVIEFISERGDANRTAGAANTAAHLYATLRQEGMAPLHLLALYAPDSGSDGANGKPGNNVLAAQHLLAAGANLSKSISEHDVLTPLVFAGERGHTSLFRYFLSRAVPSSFGLSPESVPRTAPEQAEYDEWLTLRNQILAQETEGLPLLDEEGGLVAWADYLEWFEGHRPRTQGELAGEELVRVLRRTLELSVVDNQLDTVRILLEGPFEGYGLLAGPEGIDTRSFGGKGDTVLQGAVAHGLQDMAALLLQHGADMSLRSHDDLTLVQMALQHKQFDMASWIEKKLQEKRPPPRAPRPPEPSAMERMRKAVEEKKAAVQQQRQQQDSEMHEHPEL